jgi:hypothetical protein
MFRFSLRKCYLSLTLTPRLPLDLILWRFYGITENKPSVKAIQNINQNVALSKSG